MKRLRFAILGCGVIAPTHAYCILQQPGTEITAVCDILPDRAERLSKAFAGEIYTDYRQMLQRKDIDVVSICTPSGMHAEMAIAAAQAGKHVIVEKPIDVSLEKADRLIAACRSARVSLACISQHRFDPAVVDLKAAILAGRLGQLNFSGSYTQWYRSQEYYDSGDWRGTWELEGGGALINQSIHYIDLQQYLMGPVEQLFAYTATRAHTRIEVEDLAVASLRFQSGALGVIEGMTSAFPGFCTRLEIFGSRGGVVIEDDHVKEWRLADGETYSAPSAPVHSIASSSSLNIWPEGHGRQYQDILATLREGRPSSVDGREGRKPLAIVLAVYASARSGKPARPG
jgi:predicted dehydrogenase